MSTFGSSTFRPASTQSSPASSPASSSLRTLRSQVAFVRSLLDEIERVAPASTAAEELSEQIAEEIARLGSRSLQVAAELRRLVALAAKCA